MQRKQNKGENKRKKHSFSIQYKIMGITIIPLVFLGIVVSVIAEDGGTGSSAAVPIAREVFNAYYNYVKTY